MNENDKLVRILADVKVEGEHWLWTGAVTQTNHAVVSFENITYSVQRLMFELYYDEVPPGSRVEHISACKHKNCIKPQHLMATIKTVRKRRKHAV